MTAFLGAVMVLLAGGGLGLAAVCEMARGIRQTEDMARIVGRMRTEICLRQQPLPTLLKALEQAEPAYFRGAGACAGQLRDIPFEALWTACIRAIRLPAPVEEALCRLGGSLSRGDPPQEAFAVCLEQLEELRGTLKKRREELGRVYVAAGFAVGGLFVIVLL